MNKDNLRNRLMALTTKYISSNDIVRSATVSMLESLLPLLETIGKSRFRDLEKFLDIGCGFCGLTALIAEFLGIKKAYGIDKDETVSQECTEKGIEVINMDVSEEDLPFPDESFDLVSSFGVLEHLPYIDRAVNEMYRVLRDEGYILISIPNLASWINRFALLLGYQPRDVEYSRKVFLGGLPQYSNNPIGHIHSITLKAFV